MTKVLNPRNPRTGKTIEKHRIPDSWLEEMQDES